MDVSCFYLFIPGEDVEVRVLLVPYHLLKDSMFIQKSHGTIRILVISKSVWEFKIDLKLIFPTGTTAAKYPS